MPKPDYTSLDLPEPPPDRPYVLVNMVSSLDGKVVIEGNEQGLGSSIDKRLMRELRVNADIVMNGAGTLRASGTSSRLDDPALEELRMSRGKPRAPLSAVISRSGDLPLHRAFFTADDFGAVLYLSGTAPPERRRAIEATGRPVIEVPTGNEVPATLRHMRHELGANVLLVEGGPALNRQLFDIGAVDEFFLTIGAVIVGGKDKLTAVEGEASYTRDTLRRLQLVAAVPNQDTNEVYLHYRARQ
jgi:2,5-diamino-6-(ribosylamino)-4(3H)-pyrimidinone 5'-phosphate reductase